MADDHFDEEEQTTGVSANLQRAFKDPASRIRMIGFAAVIAVFSGVVYLYHRSGHHHTSDNGPKAKVSLSGAGVAMSPPDSTKQPVNPGPAALDRQFQEKQEHKAVKNGTSYIPPIPVLSDAGVTPSAPPAAVVGNGQGASQSAPPAKHPHHEGPHYLASNNPQVQADLKAIHGMENHWSESAPSVKVVTFQGDNTDQGSQGSGSTAGSGQATPSNQVAAGTVWYAETTAKIDTYTPGPVTARIEQGPYAGGILIGKFQSPHTPYVTIRFNELSFHKHTISVDAILVDPATRAPAIKGNVDRHLLLRAVLPTAIAFLSNYANALSFGATTVASTGGVVTQQPSLSTGQALKYAAGKGIESGVSPVLHSMANNAKSEISLPQHTGIGVMILKAF